MSAQRPEEPERLAAAAGASVTDHVRALLAEAELKAKAILEEATSEAERVREEGAAEGERLNGEALAAARGVLQRVTAIEERLGALVSELREEALGLPSGEEGLAEMTPDETLPPSAVPGAALDVEQLAQNLRTILDGPAAPRSRDDVP